MIMKILVMWSNQQQSAGLTIACQILGAVIAAAVVYSMFESEMAASATLPAADNVTRAFILETVMTFTLVYVVLATTTSKKFQDSAISRGGNRVYPWI
jgi:aquaporin Z